MAAKVDVDRMEDSGASDHKVVPEPTIEVGTVRAAVPERQVKGEDKAERVGTAVWVDLEQTQELLKLKSHSLS